LTAGVVKRAAPAVVSGVFSPGTTGVSPVAPESTGKTPVVPQKETIMRKESLAFLETIVSTPSPSGFEQPVQRVIREYVSPFADEVSVDVSGNLTAVLNPGGHPRVMLAGHCDQIGFMVQHISDDGCVYFSAIGGIDAAIIPGERVAIHTRQGRVPGVIGRKPIHLQKPEDRKNEPKDLSQLWIDIGAADKKEAEGAVEIGDPITFELGLMRLLGQRVAAPGMDDKVGAFAVMEAVRLLAKRKPRCAVFAVSTVQEELGIRGARTIAYALDPQAAIAVDVTFATDHPQVEKNAIGDLRLGKGPVIATGPNINPALHGLLVQAAKQKRISWQPEAISRATGTDANVIQISRAGVAAALVSVPNRYMHTQVEIISLDDLQRTAQLLAETLMLIGPETDFTPR
jgi:endoglucanase